MDRFLSGLELQPWHSLKWLTRHDHLADGHGSSLPDPDHYRPKILENAHGASISSGVSPSFPDPR